MASCYYLRADRARPQYWSLVTFLFTNREGIDTDGDSFPGTSTVWTWLSIRKRDADQQVVEIYSVQSEPLVLVVESTSSQLAARAVYYLAKTMDTVVWLSETGPALDLARIEAAMGDDFDITEAWQRVAGRGSPG